MAIETRLARELIRIHPERAASVLERFAPEQAARVLRAPAPRDCAEVIRRLAPGTAAAVLEQLPDERVAELLEILPSGVASRLVRRLDDERAREVLGRVPPRVARGIRAMIRFPENSAGALMDPHVLSLAEDLTAREALERVRQSPEDARYNVYIVDQEQKLVGVVNLRELFLAAPRQRLSDLMVRQPLTLDARADRSVVISHPGWREVHSLPVVDSDGCYLGAIRYRTLRQLEDQLLGGGGRDESAQEALGELFSAGAGGLLDALTGPSAGRGGRS